MNSNISNATMIQSVQVMHFVTFTQNIILRYHWGFLYPSCSFMAYATVEKSRVLILKAATLTDLQKLQKKPINV